MQNDLDVILTSPVSHDDALTMAQCFHRPHSLVGSKRFWQHLAYVSGVSAWGYAYEGGKFEVTK